MRELPKLFIARTVANAVDSVRSWPVRTQLGARRNAMIAATALAQRRAEAEEVEKFLALAARASAPEMVAVRAAHG